MRMNYVLPIGALSATSLATCGIPYPASKVNGTLLNTVVLDMGTDASNVTAPQYNQYFSQGSALEGTEAIVASGNFFISE